MKKLTFLPLFLLFSLQNNAQHCGMAFSDLQQLAARNLQLQGVENPDSNSGYVPIFFHLVAKTDGTNAAREIQVLDALCTLNELYLQTNIQFYLSEHPTTGELFGHSLMDDDLIFWNGDHQAFEAARHPNAVNVFVVQNIVFHFGK